jgi:hypothetical protein
VGQLTRFFWNAWNVTLSEDIKDSFGNVTVPQNFSLVGEEYVWLGNYRPVEVYIVQELQNSSKQIFFYY